MVGKTLPLISELKTCLDATNSVWNPGAAVPAGSEYGLIVFFNNYGSGSNHNAGLRYYDDITYENGSAIVAADASLVPATAAPTPTHGSLNTDPNADAADVFNIFSDHYPNSILWCPDNEARAGWSAGELQSHIQLMEKELMLLSCKTTLNMLVHTGMAVVQIS